MAIGAASTQLVNDFAQQLITPGSQVRTILDQRMTDKLTALEGNNPTIPVVPLAGALRGQIRNLAEALLETAKPELVAAIQTVAQARVSQLKAQLSGQIANRLTNQLNRSFSFYDDWFDSVIGLRGRFNLNKAFYLTAESDVGGFGIDLTSLCRFMPHWAVHATSGPRPVTGIIMMISATRATDSFINFRSMAHKLTSG